MDSFFKELKGHSKNRLEMAIKKVSIFPLISYFFKEKLYKYGMNLSNQTVYMNFFPFFFFFLFIFPK